MINELLWVFLLLFIFLGVIASYKLFGRTGLYVWTAISIILANIQVLKTIKVFGFVTAEGNIIYSSTFLITDILCENYGKKEANKAVIIGFFVLIMTAVVMQVTLQFVPDESDIMSPALEQVFGFFPRIVVASLAAYLVSQFHDVWAFQFWKKKTKGKHLWIRNNASTMVSQLLDNAIFTYIAFVGAFGLESFFTYGRVHWEQVFEWPIIIEIFWVSYVMKFVVAVCDTPFVYWARRLKKEADRADG